MTDPVKSNLFPLSTEGDLIHRALSFLTARVNQFLEQHELLLESGAMVLAPVVDQVGDTVKFPNLGMTLLGIEEERIGKTQSPYAPDAVLPRSRTEYRVVNPQIKLNLNVLIAANFAGSGDGTPEGSYAEALKYLSYVIFYFQGKQVFTPEDVDSGDLAPIEKLVIELMPKSMNDLYQIWSTLGAKYLPSVVYRLRLLVVQRDISVSAPTGVVPEDYEITLENLAPSGDQQN